jgi:hypothetical protein
MKSRADTTRPKTLRQHMRSRGWTVKDLVHWSEVKKSTVYLALRGCHVCTESAVKIALALGLTVDEFDESGRASTDRAYGPYPPRRTPKCPRKGAFRG